MKVTYFYKYKNLITNIFIYGIIFYLLMHSKILVESISTSTNIFITKLLPALFPYILITELLINSGKIENLSFSTSNIIAKIFNIPKNTTPCVIIGFLLGYPNSAKYISKLYQKGQIDSITCKKLVSFTSNANLSYIIATIGIGIFDSFQIGIILAVSHFLASIIIGIFFYRSCNNNIIQQRYINANSFEKINSPFELLYKSIYGSLKTLAYIFSYTVIFSLIPHVMFNSIKIPKIIKTIITGLLELSNGIHEISILSLALKYKIILTSFLISFSSIMIHIQIYSFVYFTKIKFRDLFKFKLIQGCLSCIITYIILKFIYIPSITVSLNVDNFNFKNTLSCSTVYMFTIFIILITCCFLLKKRRHD